MPAASAFMNNTPIVVMMMPVVVSLSRRFGVNPSKLLLPVSYFAIIGGTVTLLGTSTNILVDDIYRQLGGPGFSLFDFAPLGLIYVAVGIGYIVTVGYRLLPDRTPPLGLNTRGEGSAYVTEVVVPAHSKLIGRTPGQFMQLRSFQRPSPRRDRNLSLRRRIGRSPSAGQEKTVTHIELLEIVRNERLIVAEEAGELPLAEGDRLLVSGGANEITAFLKETQTVLATVLADDKQVPLSSLQQTVVEAVVLPDSPFSGRVMGELGLRRRFGV
ncbi:MAG TPA: SLC13 family permease, partial [Caldilineaceae bacterium]|nr:SLC13 family permease [Caldilineaceae bacterium]